MPETKPAWEPIEDYLTFVTYPNQETAAAAAAPGARNYVATEDQKDWYDRNAGQPSPGKRLFTSRGVPWVLYLYGAFTGKLDNDGNGIVEDLAMTVDEAAKVNIIPKGPNMTNIPQTGNTVPVPFISPLSPTQKIRREMPMGGFKIRNIDVLLPGEQAQQNLENTLAEILANQRKIMTALGIA
jgi:hypothetical protein